MCHKLCKKCCGMLFFLALFGGFLYLLGCLKGKDEDGSLAENMREKKDRLREACGRMKDQSEEIADEVQFAARYSAGEMREGLENTGEAVKTAAGNIREDLGEIRDAARSVFKDGEDA